MSPLTLKAQALTAVAVAALSFGAGWGINGWRWEAKYNVQATQVAQASQKRTERVLQRTDEVRQADTANQQKADHVDKKTQAAQSVVRVAADVGSGELRRLRDDLDAVRRNAVSEAATRASLVAYSGALSDSLSECSGRYQTVAEERDGLAVQVSGLLDLLPPK